MHIKSPQLIDILFVEKNNDFLAKQIITLSPLTISRNGSLKIFALVILFGMLPFGAFSQKVKKTQGSSEVRVEYNITKEQAKEKAEELAKINAIEQVFGTLVEQQSDMTLRNGRVNFDIIGSTTVKGEWVKTSSINYTELTRSVSGKNGVEQELWITCNIKGEVRESVSRAAIEFYTLNCPTLQCRQTDFKNGEDFYLYFKSPVDGFLSVFLDDNNFVYRLLPYKEMGAMSAIKIKGDHPYIFFSKNKTLQYDPQFVTDELMLFTDSSIEYNQLYLIFAETPYIKPILNDNTNLDENRYGVPKSMNKDIFQNWLSENMAVMKDFQQKRIKISIQNE